MERAVYRRAIQVITLSEAFRDIAHRDYGIPLAALRVVPGGVNLAPYLATPSRREARERLGWPSDRPILLTVRRLARRMGLEGLVDAIGLLKRTHPNVLLLIGGKGLIIDELRARIQEAKLQDNVRMLGFVSDADLPLAYAAADLTVVPTMALEGFGLVTAEALAAGTPVVGTPVGGTPEVLRGLEPQLIFDSVEPRALAERLNEILSGRVPLPDEMACRAHAARYGWEVVAPQMRAIFDEVVHPAGTR
jgi:glycosyltransferase involved in cell wall biosynthesis